MFLQGQDSQPESSWQTFVKVMVSFGIGIVLFETGASYLRQYLLPKRYPLPYIHRQYKAHDEHYPDTKTIFDDHYFRRDV